MTGIYKLVIGIMNNKSDTIVIINDSINSLADKVNELNQPTCADCILAVVICGGILLFALLLIFAFLKARTMKNANDQALKRLENDQAEKMKKLEYKRESRKAYLEFCYRMAEKKDFDLTETRDACCNFLTEYGKQFKNVDKANESNEQ